MEYEFIIDPSGTNTIVPNPVNWNESTIMVFRDKEIKGLFQEYITTLVFHGLGFDTLIALYDADICQDVELRIRKKCEQTDPFVTIFDGLIELSNPAGIKIDRFRCRFETPVVDNSNSALLLRMADVQVPIDSSGFTIDGATAIADIGISTSFHTTNGGAGIGNRTTFRIRDLWQYILSYISNNVFNFVSDFYEVQTNSIETITFTFGGAAPNFVVGNVITITYLNYYNDTISKVIPFNTNHVTTLGDITIALSHNSAGVITSTDVYNWDMATFSKVDDDGLTTVTTETWVPFTLHTCVVTGGATQPTCSIAQSTNITDGGKHISVTSGSLLNSIGNSQLEVSFRELFIEFNKLHNISFKMEDISGTPTVTIEQTEDFYTNTITTTLNNVPNISETLTTDFQHPTVRVGSVGAEGRPPFTLWWVEQWDVGDCVGDQLDLKSSALIGAVSIASIVSASPAVITDPSANTDMVITEVTNDAGTATQQYDFQKFRTDVPGFPSFQLYNAFMTTSWKLRYHFFNLTGDVSGANQNSTETINKVITNDSALNLQRLHEFEFPLSETDWDTLNANRDRFVRFDDGVNPSIDGWIQELERPIKTGNITFKLISE